MPDISMCRNRRCSLRANCVRYLAVPSERLQAYISTAPNDDGTCDHQWKIDAGGKTYPIYSVQDADHRNLRDLERMMLSEG